MDALNLTDATNALGDMTDWDADPALSADQKSRILTRARRADRFGRRPSDPLWEGRWDLTWAAAEAWGMKAAKAANRFAFSLDQQSVSRNQIIKHCLEMQTMYRRRMVSSIPVYGQGRAMLVEVF